MKIKTIISEFRNHQYDHFEEFYQMTERHVYFSIFMIVKNQDVTKDLMQDTYMKFLEKIDQYNAKYKVTTYLFTIARNLAINYYRKEKRNIHQEDVFEYIASRYKVDENEYMLDLLDQLDENKKYIVTMHVINDMKFKDIAFQMNMPLGTVQWHYHEAIKILKWKVGE
ncbi:sigma-70 family RNA polymerase sigma factor [Mycoplasmatota bacterium]|nr:sigma-70 family RNA polymerase sigma factor [Mycoplasmatota bacterium]